jgi:FAD-linked oxidoreductase
MKNWAGNLVFDPSEVITPGSVEEIKAAVKKASLNKKKIRTRGTGHSWTGLITTQDIFLHLDKLQGVLEVNKANKTIKAYAGTKLFVFGEEAFKSNLAMENQGDINKQSIAGATSTGTHGTGISLQSVANQIEAMTIINSQGEEIRVDMNSPYFQAARLSLGSLGIISDMTFKLSDAYKLKEKSFAEDFSQSLKEFRTRLKSNRHLEMFYFPVGDWSLTKMMNISAEEPSSKNFLHALNEVILENWLYTQLNRIASTTGRYKLIDKIMRTFVSPKENVDWSHRAFPTERSFKFMEMEYNLPVEKFEVVMDEVRKAIRKNKFQTLFPIEIRFVKADPLWLSPAYERDSVYLAVHTYISEDYRPYFDCMEEIFQRHEGRPHWGKWHTMKKEKFKAVYPRFEDFLAVRKEFDPEGMFLNDHLKEIFGL